LSSTWAGAHDRLDTSRLESRLPALLSVIAGMVVSFLGDWAWSLPVVLAATAAALRY
jgi:hypothetical protein